MAFKLKAYEPKEKEIQSAILDYLKARKVFCWKEHSGGLPVQDGKYFIPIGLKGKSDILGIYKGRFLAIEVKRPSGVLSPDQAYFLKKIKEEGGISFVAHSIDEVIENLNGA